MSNLDSRKGLDVTIYAQETALVKDLRSLHFPHGFSDIIFTHVSDKLLPESIFIHVNSEDKLLKVLEQSFEYDQLNKETILHHSVGQNIELFLNDKNSKEISSQKGNLVAVKDKQLIIDTGTQFYITDQVQNADFSIQKIPDSISIYPTIRALLKSDKQTESLTEINYLTKGLRWKMGYLVEVDQTGLVNFYTKVSITNSTSVDFQNAKVRISTASQDVDDDSEEKTEKKTADKEKDDSKNDPKKSAPTERLKNDSERFSQTFNYDIPELIDLPRDTTKQYEIITANAIASKKEYSIKIPAVLFIDGSDSELHPKVNAWATFSATTFSKKGLILPPGQLYVFQKDASGHKHFVGVSDFSSQHKEGKIKLPLGQEPLLQSSFVQTDIRRLGDKIVEVGYLLTIQNSLGNPTAIKTSFRLPYETIVLKESQTHAFMDNDSIAWNMNIPGKGKTELRFRLRYNIQP